MAKQRLIYFKFTLPMSVAFICGVSADKRIVMGEMINL
jgi:hypothetical protein